MHHILFTVNCNGNEFVRCHPMEMMAVTDSRAVKFYLEVEALFGVDYKYTRWKSFGHGCPRFQSRQTLHGN